MVSNPGVLRSPKAWVTAGRMRSDARAAERLQPPPQTTGTMSGVFVNGCPRRSAHKLDYSSADPIRVMLRRGAWRQTHRPTGRTDLTHQAQSQSTGLSAPCCENIYSSCGGQADAFADCRRKCVQCLHVLQNEDVDAKRILTHERISGRSATTHADSSAIGALTNLIVRRCVRE